MKYIFPIKFSSRSKFYFFQLIIDNSTLFYTRSYFYGHLPLIVYSGLFLELILQYLCFNTV